jgi:hypothetical protein
MVGIGGGEKTVQNFEVAALFDFPYQTTEEE